MSETHNATEVTPVRRRDLRRQGYFDHSPQKNSQVKEPLATSPAPRVETTAGPAVPESQPRQVNASSAVAVATPVRPASEAAPVTVPGQPAASGPNSIPKPLSVHDKETFGRFPPNETDIVRSRSRKKRQAIIFSAVLILFIGLLGGLVYKVGDATGLLRVKDYSGDGTTPVAFTIDQGAGGLAIAQGLQEEGVVADAKTFLGKLSEEANGREIQPGTYDLKKQMSNAAALGALLSRDDAKILYIPLQPGLRVNESLEAISKGSHVELATLENLNKNPAQFGLPAQAKSLEGYLMPGEYRYPVGTKPEKIIQDLVDKTKDYLAKGGVNDPTAQYRILTLASIVQAESNSTDYAKIAGALANRLKDDNTETGGRLESDSTVTYGLGRKSLNLTPEEKRDTSNPYNTYAHTGLPVGPIDSPGTNALDAALKPESNPYYYWVTVNPDTGETLFASTLSEHEVNVEKYQQWCSVNPGKCE